MIDFFTFIYLERRIFKISPFFKYILINIVHFIEIFVEMPRERILNLRNLLYFFEKQLENEL